MSRNETKNRLTVIIEDLGTLLFDIEDSLNNFHPAEINHLVTAIQVLEELNHYLSDI